MEPAEGAEAYAVALQMNTTTSCRSEIHARGLREVSASKANGPTVAGLDTPRARSRSALPRWKKAFTARSPDPRPMLIEGHGRILRDAEVRAGAFFDLRPTAPVQVLREPAFTEKNAAAHYAAPDPRVPSGDRVDSVAGP